MKKIFSSGLTILALAAAGPAFAATGGGTLPAGQVPFCSSSTAQRELDSGEYQDQLQRKGSTLDSVELWNGCVEATYTDASGHSSMAIYDPDTLKLLTTLGTSQG